MEGRRAGGLGGLGVIGGRRAEGLGVLGVYGGSGARR